MQALTDVFGPAGAIAGPCWLGAVKSNIGHLGAAAGVAGLIKTALMLEHRELVPTLHYAAPNPLLELDLTPFRVSTATRPWPDRPGGARPAGRGQLVRAGRQQRARRAGPAPPRRGTPASRPGPRLLALSAASTDALHRLRDTMATRLEAPRPAAGVVPAAPGAHCGWRARWRGAGRTPYRQAFVAADLAEAAGLLRDAADPAPVGRLGKVAFLFPGQGTLRTAAGAAAYRLLPGFRACFDEIRDTVAAAYGLDLSPVVAEQGAPEEWFRDTVHQQLGLFALGCGLARQLGDWRIRPAVMLGNSIGEYVAATLAGTWTVADGARLVHERARAMWDTEPGLMASVAAPAAEVRRRIGPDGAVPVAVASPGAAVVSGARADMERLLAGDALHGLDVRRLDVERAFHCATMDPAAEVLRAAVAAVPSRRPAGRLVSNSTGDYADPDALRTPAYWAAHLRRPVLLDASMRVLLDSGCDTYLELGPGSSMIAALRRGEGLGTRPHDRADARPGRRRGARTAAGARHALGARRRLALDALDDGGAVRCSLPAHPFAGRDPDEGAAPAPPGGRRRRPGRSPAAGDASAVLGRGRPPAGAGAGLVRRARRAVGRRRRRLRRARRGVADRGRPAQPAAAGDRAVRVGHRVLRRRHLRRAGPAGRAGAVPARGSRGAGRRPHRGRPGPAAVPRGRRRRERAQLPPASRRARRPAAGDRAGADRPRCHRTVHRGQCGPARRGRPSGPTVRSVHAGRLVVRRGARARDGLPAHRRGRGGGRAGLPGRVRPRPGRAAGRARPRASSPTACGCRPVPRCRSVPPAGRSGAARDCAGCCWPSPACWPGTAPGRSTAPRWWSWPGCRRGWRAACQDD